MTLPFLFISFGNHQLAEHLAIEVGDILKIVRNSECHPFIPITSFLRKYFFCEKFDFRRENFWEEVDKCEGEYLFMTYPIMVRGLWRPWGVGKND